MKTKYANPFDDYPDIEFHFMTGAVNLDGGARIKTVRAVTDEFYNKTYAPYNFRNTISITPTILRPKSRGEFAFMIFSNKL